MTSISTLRYQASLKADKLAKKENKTNTRRRQHLLGRAETAAEDCFHNKWNERLHIERETYICSYDVGRAGPNVKT